jgi:HPt (histidine-containing phosphotransfer) domain-containing protein
MANSFVEDAPIYSSLATDPMMAELVEMYVDETSEKIAAMEAAFASGDREKLRSVAHQMKGAAGSYGFDQVTAGAAALEAAVRDAQPAATVQARFDELVGLCRRIRSGTGPTE